jgi:RNase H-fold protein (predicted Holliday junction resolvase)
MEYFKKDKRQEKDNCHQKVAAAAAYNRSTITVIIKARIGREKRWGDYGDNDKKLKFYSKMRKRFIFEDERGSSDTAEAAVTKAPWDKKTKEVENFPFFSITDKIFTLR